VFSVGYYDNIPRAFMDTDAMTVVSQTNDTMEESQVKAEDLRIYDHEYTDYEFRLYTTAVVKKHQIDRSLIAS
jgi:hypothetical protein